MNLVGGGVSAEGFVDTGSQEKAGAGVTSNDPPRSPDWFFRAFLVFITLTVVGLGILIFFSILPPDDSSWPPTPEAWSAWGTWAGAGGSIGAVIYASKSIKHAIEAQKGTERELKRDREHDRQEREKERALVREEREALTKEKDRIALNHAGRLKFTYSTSKPSDEQYAEVQARRWEQQKVQEQEQSDPFYAMEEDDSKTQVAYILIQNPSDSVFDDVTLWLREDKFTPTDVEVADRDSPPARATDEDLEGSPPKWTWRTDYDAGFPPGTNQWVLGSVGRRRELLVKFNFATAQHIHDWFPGNLWRDQPGADPPRHLILGYRDQDGRHWVRSTRSSQNRPQRLLHTTSVA